MYFEEFTPGLTMTTARRTMTVQDIEQFVALSGLDNHLFTSDEGARRMGHAGRLVPAPLQLSVAMGLAQGAGVFDHVVAVIGFDRMRFVRPVRPGHGLELRIEVLKARPTRNPRRGLVILAYQMLNQDGDEVMTSEALYLMQRRG